MRIFFASIKFFDCLFKFWTLPYGPKAQWSNSQKFSSETPIYVPFLGIFHIPVLIHEGRTPPLPNRVTNI